MALADGEFEKLALEQLDTLYRVARRLTRDPERAEDLVQETYVRALRAKGDFRLEQYGIRPWLLRILHNLHLNRIQHENRAPKAVEDQQLETAGPVDDRDSPIDPRSWDAMDEQLVQAVEALPEDYANVLMLWAVEELSYKEIGEALSIPLGTVMSRLYRARQRLAQQLRGYALKEGIIRE